MSLPSGTQQGPFSYTAIDPQYLYDEQASQLDLDLSQWQTSTSPNAQFHMPNAPTSVTNAVASPHSGPIGGMYSQQPSFAPMEENMIDPSLSSTHFLTVPSHPSHSSYDNMARYMQDPPWNANNLRSSNGNGSSSLNQPNDRYGPSRGVDSDIAHSDSGYQSQAPMSVLSNEPSNFNLELPSNITHNMGNLCVESASSEATPMSRKPSDQLSRISERSGKSGKQFKCEEPNCMETMKCNSDLTKHMLKHNKPYRCDIPGCKRVKGFTTTNDLDRHKKSVHRIGLDDGSFKCASETCRNKEKIWPRLDNFKQHIERMHATEDQEDLIQRWHARSKTSAHTMDSAMEDSLDTNLAVAGIEPVIGSLQALAFTLEQDPASWSLLNDHLPTSNHPSQLMAASHDSDFQSRPQQAQGAETSNEGLRRASGTVLPIASDPAKHYTRNLHTLSNEPQKKSDRIKVTSQNKSKAAVRKTRKTSTSKPVDLKAVLRLLQNSSNSSTEGEAATMIEALKRHIQQEGSERSKRRSDEGKAACHICPYTVARECDLRKHMKRHERPYGCTYPRCYKRFGAKSDWKRHENSQHFQLEAFRCAQRSTNGAICGKYEQQETRLKRHLETEHKTLAPNQITAEVQRCRIGKNCQNTFWCGFCEQIVELKEMRNAAWDERFNHIADHFEKHKKSIDQWICAETNKPKCELDREVLERNGSDDADDKDDTDAQGEDDDGPPPPPSVYEQLPAVFPMSGPVPPAPPQSFQPHETLKRQPSASPVITKRENLQRQPSASPPVITKRENFKRQPSSSPPVITKREALKRQPSASPPVITKRETFKRQPSASPVITKRETLKRQPSAEPVITKRKSKRRRPTQVGMLRFCCECGDSCATWHPKCAGCQHEVCAVCNLQGVFRVE